ncbi:MAG: hypothetical protein K2M07_04145 [Muribaculaceae bacterium]|nr:hypothetical protein [Muribaculaceae bacterium]
MEYDYEELEEHFGSILRDTNYVDLAGGVFLPVKFIGRLMEFSVSLADEVRKKNADVRVSILNKEFNRWIDDMVAQLSLTVVSDLSVNPVKCQLIDVEQMVVEPGQPALVILSGERGSHTVLDSAGEAIYAESLSDLHLDVDFSRLLEHDLQGIEYLASLLIRAARAMKTELTADMFDEFSNRFFDYFKFDLEQLAPGILEDLQTIADHRLVRLGIV